jgi:ABC-2 type transport system permease protein
MTITATTPVRRHPFWKLARAEAVLLLRMPGALIWMALLPIAAAVVLGVVPGTSRPAKALGGISYLDAYLPILMMFTLLMSGINLLSALLASYREKGILRRLATTPVPPSRLLGAQALIYLGVGMGIDVVLLIVGIASGVPVPHQLGGFVLSLLLVALAILGLGVLVTAVAPSARIAQAVSTVVLFPLMFFAGLWLPRAEMPSTLRTVSDYTPLGAGVQAVQASIEGHWPSTVALLVLAGYALACGALANRVFRWE